MLAALSILGCSEAGSAGPGHDAGVEGNSPNDAAGPSDASDGSQPTLGVISVADLAGTLSGKSFLLINVHTPYAGEIPGTDASISYQDVPAIEAFIGSDRSVSVVVYCMTNAMATIAGKALVADGYEHVRYLDGGLGAWENAGYPVDFHDQ